MSAALMMAFSFVAVIARASGSAIVTTVGRAPAWLARAVDRLGR
jgi:hypothetical protein